MIRKLLFVGLLTFNIYAFSQELKSFRIYDDQKEEITFEEMIEGLSGSKVILFGELHDHPVIHWLQFKTTEALYRKNDNLILGAEMFEADNQLIFNEYLNGKIGPQHFEKEMRLWDNYATDYKPLIDFAKKHHLPFIATNVPRRYAAAVARFGLDSLSTFSAEAKSYIAALPVQVDTITPGYADMYNMMGGAHGKRTNALFMVQAQAIKDATMAEKILKNLPDSGTFLHYNGDYHSKDHGGIYYYLKQNNGELKIKVISVQQVASPNLGLVLEQTYPGQYTIVVPADFNRSF